MDTENGQQCIPFPSGSTVKQIVAGGEQACARLLDGRVKCWGRNDYFQVGDGSDQTVRSSPVTVLDVSNAFGIAAGTWYGCALTGNGRAQCWGNNDLGTLGNNSTKEAQFATQVYGIDGVNASAVEIAGSADHTCLLLSDASIRCFGDDTYGELGDNGSQLGDSGSPIITVPVVSQSPMTATSLALGSGFTCVLAGGNSTVWCWGQGFLGELGNGSFANSLAPVLVQLPDHISISAIASKAQFVCALSTDGRLWCWGANSFGQLGNGTANDSKVPVDVPAPDAN
jgi:alpha-tubulin suppressor-like RCC1 family protein